MEFWAVRQLCERTTEAWWPCVYVADSDFVAMIVDGNEVLGEIEVCNVSRSILLLLFE